MGLRRGSLVILNAGYAPNANEAYNVNKYIHNAISDKQAFNAPACVQQYGGDSYGHDSADLPNCS